MPDPYANLFDDLVPKKSESPRTPIVLPEDSFVPENAVEPLDAILAMCLAFKPKGEQFSTVLSETRAIDHEDEAKRSNLIYNLLFVPEKRLEKGSLTAEKAHYALLQQKFTTIIESMKILATEHWEIVKKFNADIDKHYYSIEKSKEQVTKDIETAVDFINLQRSILANASRDLSLLEGALKTTENRLKNYVDVGGINNLSASELAMLKLNREALTNGSNHAFNYEFFSMNFIDKVAIQLGVYLKDTTHQYLQHLAKAFY